MVHLVTMFFFLRRVKHAVHDLVLRTQQRKERGRVEECQSFLVSLTAIPTKIKHSCN